MPEGDTIHKLARSLSHSLVGRRLLRVQLQGQLHAHEVLAGREVVAVEAVGKHCLIELDDWIIRVHLGMHGVWSAYPAGSMRPPRSVSLWLGTEAEELVCKRAGEVEVLARKLRNRHPMLTRLGPDLLGTDPDLDEIWTRFQGRAGDRYLGELLLDQQVAAGFGNVYKCEVSFLGPLESDPFLPATGVSPWQPAANLPQDLVQSLYRRGIALMHANLGPWRRTTTFDARRTRPRSGAERVWVYGRTGRPCLRCRATILSRGQGVEARATQWCPNCQP